MTDYNLERFSVLVVDDNRYLRQLLTLAMKALGVGIVKQAEHGADAIEALKLMTLDPVKAGVMSIDLILSNWQMSPVDGMMLLRWVRRSKESPNRFIPFLFVTGYADQKRVGEARELGVTEMLAKPFSVNSIAEKVIHLIERPRQFVHTVDYFGPDRRRKPPVFYDNDRRKLQESDPSVEIIHD